MHEGERALAQGIGQVLVEGPDLARQQQALVDHRPRRERRQVKLGQARQVLLLGQFRQRVLHLLADGQKLALESVLVALEVGAAADKRLADHRHLVEHGLAQALDAHRHLAPAEQHLALDADEVLELVDRDDPRPRILRQETHGDAVLAGRRQVDFSLSRPGAIQRVGDLDKTAGPVADQGVSAHRPAVVQVQQDLQALLNDGMTFLAFDVGDKAHTASVMLVPRIVQTLCRRHSHQPAFSTHSSTTLAETRNGA